MHVETPHFAHPFRFEAVPGHGVSAVVTEQHSEPEIEDCVLRVVSYARGFRDDLPEFGISDPTFQQQPISVERVASEIAEWETRAEVDVLAEINSFDELIANLRIGVDVEREAV